MAGGHAWWGCGGDVCMAGGMHDKGACMVGGGMCGRWACVAGGVCGTHPTGMYSCYVEIFGSYFTNLYSTFCNIFINILIIS